MVGAYPSRKKSNANNGRHGAWPCSRLVDNGVQRQGPKPLSTLVSYDGVLLVGNSENHFEGDLAEECALEAAVDCLVQSNNVVAVSKVDHLVKSTTVDSEVKLDGCTGRVVIDELRRLHHRT